jgi:integrase
MAVVKALDQAFIDDHLICPSGKSKFEFVAPGGTGLYILVHASSPGQGTYFLRHKDGTGKTCHAPLGKTTDMTLEAAKAATAALRARPGRAPAVTEPAPPRTSKAAPVATSASGDGGVTLDAFMTEQYFPYIKGRKRSAARDDQLYRLRIKLKFGQLPLSGIKRREVERFGDELVEEGLSHASANQHMQLLRRVCKLAVGWELLERYPLSGMKLFHLDNQRTSFLNEEQVNRLVDVLRSHDNRMVSMIVLFLLSTGARLGETLRAEWKQIDVEKANWTVPATNAKSKKVNHKALNVNALQVLEELGTEDKSAYLFPSPATGKPYVTITRAWYVIRKAAGLPSTFRIHDLRHTFASRMVSAGMNLFDVQTQLSHADARTSQRYAHMSNERAQKAVNAAAFTMA